MKQEKIPVGELIIVDTRAYFKLVRHVSSLISDGITKAYQAAQERDKIDWVSPRIAQEMLGYKSNGSLQKLRDKRLIRFTQHERFIKYSRKSILEFLEDNAK